MAVSLERLVAGALGRSVAVERIERIEPWSVARVYLASGPRPTVIVKWLREDPHGFRTDPAQLLTERACLEHHAALGLEVTPVLLAVDAATRLLVLEDLAPRVALDHLIRTGHPQAGAGLHAFARSMGGLHAATAGRPAQYYQRRSALGPVDPEGDRRRGVGAPWAWSLPPFGAFGLTHTGAAVADMAAARDALVADGPFIAFSNGDAGANNFLVEGPNGRIVDWEFGGFRHAALDAAILYVPGPPWMTIEGPVAAGVENTYRRALAEGVPGADDDRTFATAMAAACLAVAVERLQRLPALDARPAGHESRAQMVSTLEAAARAAERFGAFPHLTGWAWAAGGALRRRWPDADRHFPDAYTTRQP